MEGFLVTGFGQADFTHGNRKKCCCPLFQGEKKCFQIILKLVFLDQRDSINPIVGFLATGFGLDNFTHGDWKKIRCPLFESGK